MPAYQPLFHITNQMLMYVSSVSEKIGEINVIRNMEKRPHLRKNNRINREAEIRDMLKYSVFFWYFFRSGLSWTKALYFQHVLS